MRWFKLMDSPVTIIIYYIDLGKLIGTKNRHQSEINIVNEWCMKCCLFAVLIIIELKKEREKEVIIIYNKITKGTNKQ